MAQRIDPRMILRGFDGELYADDGTFLAQVNTWSASVSVSNTTYQPAGSPLEVAIPTSYSVSLTFEETIVRDEMLSKLLTALRDGKDISFGFIGVLRGRDGSTGRYVFRSCVPDGEITIANVQPGNILTRPWSWRVNEPPDLQSLLGR